MANPIIDGFSKLLAVPATQAPVVVGAAAGLMIQDGVYDFVDVFKEGKADNEQGPEFKLIWHGAAKVTFGALVLGALYTSSAKGREKILGGVAAAIGGYFAHKISGQNQKG